MGENENYGVEKIRFPQLEGSGPGPRIDQRMMAEIPIEAVVELGKAKMTLREVLELAQGSIIALDKIAGEPLDIKVGGQTVAKGEVVAVDDCYAIKITKVMLS